ncbi:MAG: penicillin-binding protein 2 [Verrucomicrobia bacterium]|nr:MAG: penicillin-binding protein 2 [Verrucomicrobiota bacterium]
MLIFDQLRKNDRQLQVLAACVLSGLGLLLLGLWYVQVLSVKRYQTSQINQSFRTVRIPAIRGKIFDANGVALAENRPSYNVNLYLDELRPYFQSAYSNQLSGVMRELTRTNSKARLTRNERIELGKLTRYQVVSNLVWRVTSVLKQPQLLNEKQFLEHYDQRLFLPMPVLSDLDPQSMALFAEQSASSPGFDLEVQPVRSYPHHSSAAHILGYLLRNDSSADEDIFFNYRMPDFKGVTGVEGALDEQLRGKTGIKSVLVNSLGYRQSENVWSPSEAGQNVYLTIDLAIQKAAEEALRSAPVPYSGPPRGAVVVMDPRSGDLIAMASNPSFDPNEFVSGLSREEWQRLNDPKLRPQINRAMQENYAPGSIFKIVVGLAGLEAGTINPNEIYHSKGYYELTRGHPPIGDTAGPGDFNFRRALVKSSNPYFIHQGLKLGVDRIVEMGKRFHLGERTGILPRQEAAGNLPTREWREQKLGGAWFEGNTANLSIGQEIDVTPLQVAVMISAVANGGKVFWPRLVARIEPQDPFTDQQPLTFRSRVRDELKITKSSLDTVRDAMLADVEDSEGTGTRAAVPGMRICAKTGTAQIKQGRKTVGHTTWFASFAPYSDPRYVVVVMLETEQAGSGGATCAPVAQQVYRALQKREQQMKSNKPETLAKQ